MTSEDREPRTFQELLAPAGNWECARAAIANGADAIYFGLDRFNARLRADNFTRADLPDLMRYLHLNDAKGYVTMNTLIFTDEMGDALDYAVELSAAGVDGIIIQDIGFAWLLTEWKKQNPDIRIELHASTQMTLTSPEGLSFVNAFLNLDRAVLARELNLDDIRRCAATTSIPLETFVHGALCVAYSGQCLTSESLGQRSANRGECAQACRMPYTLVKDGQPVPLGEKRYLLSPQDLCSLDLISDLADIGVKSYKIEGRLKNPSYVAATTRAYRKALDHASGKTPHHPVANDRYALEMAFSRGFSTGWLRGTDHTALTHGKYGKKRGALAGTVARAGKGWIELERTANIPILPGDGFVLDDGSDRNDEQGGRIWKIEAKRLYFHGKGSHINWASVRPGQKVWKTDDPALNASLRKTWESAPVDTSIPITLIAEGRENDPLRITCPERSVSVETTARLQPAFNQPLTTETLQQQLSRLGGTGYRLAALDNLVPDGLIIPISAINQARRQLVRQLDHVTDVPEKTTSIAQPSYQHPHQTGTTPALSILCRQMHQIEPVLNANIPLIYLDFENPGNYREAIQQIKSAGHDTKIILATPRIQKPGETGFFKYIETCNPDGVLIRNLGACEYFKSRPLIKIGDFSLNAANPHTVAILRDQAQLDRLTISYDLNVAQVIDLLRAVPPEWLELTIHQHMPMFHMEHCVFCTFIAEAANHTNCGRPCERHHVAVRDRAGQQHPLQADAGCRNTVFNGRAQSGAAHFATFHNMGLRHYRIELLEESADETLTIIRRYNQLFDGSLGAAALMQSLNASSQLGITLMP